MTETAQVTVIGGGAVGLCVAEALSARGVTVAVLERRRCGAGASAGNAGWITPSLSVPVPGPGVPRAGGPRPARAAPRRARAPAPPARRRRRGARRRARPPPPPPPVGRF